MNNGDVEKWWDVQCCVYLLLLAQLLLLLLPLRLLTGLWWADGACEPRFLRQPSPPPRTGKNNRRLHLQVPSLFLITLTTRMRYVPPRPHPHRLNKAAGFRFSSCRDSSSPPAPRVRFTARQASLRLTTKLFSSSPALNAAKPEFCFTLPLPQVCQSKVEFAHSIGARWCGALSAGTRGLQPRQSSGSAAGPSRCSGRACVRHQQRRRRWRDAGKETISSPHLWDHSLPKHVPRVPKQRKTITTLSSHPPPLPSLCLPVRS